MLLLQFIILLLSFSFRELKIHSQFQKHQTSDDCKLCALNSLSWTSIFILKEWINWWENTAGDPLHDLQIEKGHVDDISDTKKKNTNIPGYKRSSVHVEDAENDWKLSEIRVFGEMGGFWCRWTVNKNLWCRTLRPHRTHHWTFERFLCFQGTHLIQRISCWVLHANLGESSDSSVRSFCGVLVSETGFCA